MALGNTPTSWGGVAKALHWVIAVLIIGTAALVLHINDSTWWFKSTPKIFIQYIHWHKALGLIALVLIVVRVLWRRRNTVPRTTLLTAREELWSHRVHIVIYVLMVAVPVVGWLASSFFGNGTKFWGLFELPSPLPKSKTGVAVFYWVHFSMAWTLLVLVAGHVAMALFHHFVRRNGVLRAMLPGALGKDAR
jgi:cytochrome b561